MEQFIVATAVLASVAYVVWRIARLGKRSSSPCDCCCDGCRLKEEKLRNNRCEGKKQTEKFGEMEKK
jgi:hypothetical protein